MAVDEALWVGGVGCIENALTLRKDGLGLAVVELCRRQHRDPAVVVMVVVP